jgi:hypothetical protein
MYTLAQTIGIYMFLLLKSQIASNICRNVKAMSSVYVLVYNFALHSLLYAITITALLETKDISHLNISFLVHFVSLHNTVKNLIMMT